MLARHRLRWLNGAGFALTLFFAAWLLVFLLSLLDAQFADVALPMSVPFAVVAGLALVAHVVLLGVFLFRYVIPRADLTQWNARMVLFAWTSTGALFCLTQAAVLLTGGRRPFPHLAGWFSDLYWYFCVVGTAVFLLLLWVNSEHDEAWEDGAYEYEGDEEGEHLEDAHADTTD